MADIHQSKQYEKLIRRIGYSVGLEEPVERIGKLVNLYVEERDINMALWKRLVKEEYGRKISDDLESVKWGGSRKTNKKLGAEDHFADFYSELNLISHKNNQIFPLYGLEMLSILRQYFSDNIKYQMALKSIILFFILEADGDIFLNCLLGDFEKERVKENLIQMFHTKKEAYLKSYISPYSRNKLSLLFKVQTSTAQENIFDRKVVKKEEIEIPEDYISKVLPSRKGWATQLGLFSEKIDELGLKLLSFLSKMQIINGSFAVFYCYSENHKALFIDEEKAGIPPIHRKIFIENFFLSYFESEHSVESKNKLNYTDGYNLLLKIMELYKSANKAKGLIRHQLPLQILFPVFYIILALDNFAPFDLDEFIRDEQKSPDRRIDILHLRGNETEGALSFRL